MVAYRLARTGFSMKGVMVNRLIRKIRKIRKRLFLKNCMVQMWLFKNQFYELRG
jgi:hypothetical protein